MTNRFDDVFMNWNQAYMAALTTASMGLIEIVVMRTMYKDPKMNLLAAARKPDSSRLGSGVDSTASGHFRRAVPAVNNPSPLQRKS